MKKLTRGAIEDAFMCTIDSEDDTSRYVVREKFMRYLEDNGYLEEPLTFEKIRKDCVSGESVLIDTRGENLTFIGFYENLLITGREGLISKYTEDYIAGWRIKE